jgi:hypothetical protein
MPGRIIARLLVAVLLLMTSLSFGQGSITDEAKTKVVAKHHAAMVRKAVGLLKQKADLEASLAETVKDLAKIDSGEDQVEPSSIVSGWSAIATSINSPCCYVPPVTVQCDPDK